MNSSILSLAFVNFLGYTFYNYDISWFAGICGLSVYISFTYLYKLSYNNVYFALSITPKNYIDPINGAHEIILYGFSTLHSIFISLFSTLYLLQIIDTYFMKQVFYISISYYLADIYYIFDFTKVLKIFDYFVIWHHTIMITMYYVIFIEFYDIDIENKLLHYMNTGLLAEYSICFLNYSWYLINTKQENSNKMLISTLFTLVLYFITRVLNFTRLIYYFWYDDLISALILMLPLFLINYYWFYKLVRKAKKIYKKSIE